MVTRGACWGSGSHAIFGCAPHRPALSRLCRRSCPTLVLKSAEHLLLTVVCVCRNELGQPAARRGVGRGSEALKPVQRVSGSTGPISGPFQAKMVSLSSPEDVECRIERFDLKNALPESRRLRICMAHERCFLGWLLNSRHFMSGRQQRIPS